MRAAWPLLSAIFLCGIFLGAVLPRLGLGVAGAGLLTASLFLVWAVRDGLKGLEGYFKGARGEEAVALLLSNLPAGDHVFNDLTCGRAGGIDHLVVGPNGLFVVETKCWSGNVTVEGEKILFNGKVPDRSPLEQVRASADALSQFLSEKAGVSPTVGAIVCFASNTLVPDVVRQGATWVCNASALLSVISGCAGRVSADDVERVVKVLEQKAS